MVKGKFLLSVLGVLLPVSMAAQVAKPVATDSKVDFSRYEAYAAFAYSGADQVKSASALLGVNVGVQAKLKRWFGANADFGDYFAQATANGLVKPTVTTLMAGPEFYIPADNITGFLHVLFGGEHTGNVGAKPDIAFAYAVGGGFDYALNKRFAIRLAGDGIRASTVLDPLNQGLSPHPHTNPRATIGVSYKF